MTGKITLADASYINFATFRKSGQGVETPVWFAPDIETTANADTINFYIFSAGEAGKVKRLRNSPRSRIAPCNYSGKILGDWTDTEAFILSSEHDLSTAHQALIHKYGWQMRGTDFASKLSGRFNQRAYIKIQLT
jgi:hypothetical protein